MSGVVFDSEENNPPISVEGEVVLMISLDDSLVEGDVILGTDVLVVLGDENGMEFFFSPVFS